MSGPRSLSGVATSTYQFQRIKENLGEVDLPVAWAARVTQRQTGRWKDFVWNGPDGHPQRTDVGYSVAEFMLPLSEADRDALAPDLRDKLDPEYGVAKPITTAAGLPLWDVDHAVSRIQLADMVLSELRRILTAADYIFWKPVLEAHITNDTLAMGLPDILRPPTPNGFQRTFRRMLNRDRALPQLQPDAGAAGPPHHVGHEDQRGEPSRRPGSTRSRRLSSDRC